ncbi:FMN-binding domain-containing protein [Klenkia soli]|uniref:FMN-binding domain-containing protein n=1 Tax=Klenkia soli TaxID=1052260 RepID=A0A1H0G2X4_9ACTN|nr:FMN-binding protein [Klenkia soli]SDO01268.1 FMN-binding domain-containing protein [Klenkia soli]
MKKIVLWCMSTLTVLVLLFGYHTSTSSQAAATAESSTVTPVAGSLAATPSTSASATAPAAATPSAAASATAAPESTTATTTTVTGSAADTRYGPVQVQLTVSGGTITDVSVIDYPSSNGKDQQINGRALPVLVQETLDAQSADIDMVSGATYTSDGYLQSLQSALDQAGL